MQVVPALPSLPMYAIHESPFLFEAAQNGEYSLHTIKPCYERRASGKCIEVMVPFKLCFWIRQINAYEFYDCVCSCVSSMHV